MKPIIKVDSIFGLKIDEDLTTLEEKQSHYDEEKDYESYDHGIDDNKAEDFIEDNDDDYDDEDDEK